MSFGMRAKKLTVSELDFLQMEIQTITLPNRTLIGVLFFHDIHYLTSCLKIHVVYITNDNTYKICYIKTFSHSKD